MTVSDAYTNRFLQAFLDDNEYEQVPFRVSRVYISGMILLTFVLWLVLYRTFSIGTR